MVTGHNFIDNWQYYIWEKIFWLLQLCLELGRQLQQYSMHLCCSLLYCLRLSCSVQKSTITLQILKLLTFRFLDFISTVFFSVSLKNVENKSSYIYWHYWYTSLMSSVFGQLTCCLTLISRTQHLPGVSFESFCTLLAHTCNFVNAEH